MEGQPLHNATVTFNPVAGRVLRPAVGMTDSAGRFSLTTFQSNDGALRGKYKVTIEYFGPPSTGVPKTMADIHKERKWLKEVPGAPPIPRTSAFHRNYSNAELTPFELTVPCGRVNLALNRYGTKDD